MARLRAAQDWDATLDDLLENSAVEVPDYYKKPFHAYSDGNLCWEAAWEQHLASKAVGWVWAGGAVGEMLMLVVVVMVVLVLLVLV